MQTQAALSPLPSIPDIVERCAADAPDTVALRFLADGETEAARLTRGAMAARARTLAAQIAARTEPGARVLLAYPAGIEFTIAFLACLHAGAIAVPVDVRRQRGGSDRIAQIASNCAPALLLTHGSVRGRLPDMGLPWHCSDALEALPLPYWQAPPHDPDAIAYLQYTSGSTGAPRGAVITHRALMEQLADYRDRGGSDWSRHTLVSWLPHTHDFGLVGFHLSALCTGRPLIFMPPNAFLRRPLRWLEAITTWRGTCCGGPSFGYALCADAAGPVRDLDLSCWEIASLGGEHVAPETLARFEARFGRYGFDPAAWLPAYGLAEGVLCAAGRRGAVARDFDARALHKGGARAAQDGQSARLVSCGWPTAGQQLRIVDPERCAALPEGQVGEIWLSGASIAKGYWNDPDATEAQFAARLIDGGPPNLRTGDCGFLLEGELYVTGRIKDMLIVRGRNQAPEPIEATIQAIDGSMRAGGGAVVQRAAHEGGAVIAIQEVMRGIDAEPLLRRIPALVAERHGIALDEIVLVRAGSLHRTPSGKISRHRCLAEHAAGELRIVAQWKRSVASPEAPGLTADILALVQAQVPQHIVTADHNLFELGLDSLAIQTLLGQIEAQLGHAIDPETLLDAPSISAMALHLSTSPSRNRPGAGTNEMAALRAEVRRLSERTDALDKRIQVLTIALEEARSAPLATSLPDPQAPLALNDVQRELARLQELHAGAPLALVTVLKSLRPIDADQVRAVLCALTERHQALRTIFNGQTQQVLERAAPDFAEITLASTEALAAWLTEARVQPFDSGRPRWRAVLARGDDAAWLVLLADPMAVDATSLPMLAEELSALVDGLGTPLPQPPSLRAFMARREARRHGPEIAEARTYWHGLLGDALGDFAMPGISTRRAAVPLAASVRRVQMPDALRTALLRNGGRESATLFQLLLTAWLVLLHRVSGQERLSVGVDTSDRCVAEEAGTIGSCATLLPIIAEFGGPLEARALLRSVRRQVTNAIVHRDYTLAAWARDMEMVPDPHRPLLLGAAITMRRVPADLGRFEPCDALDAATLSQSPYGLLLRVAESQDGLALEFVHNRALYDAEWVGECAEAYLRLLHGMAEDLGTDVLAIPLQQTSDAPAAVQTDRADFLQRFDAQADIRPDAPAMQAAGRTISYDALRQRARSISQAVAAILPPGATVALLAQDGEHCAALIGIVAAQCVCLPLDPGLPDAELAEALRQVGASLVLHDTEHRAAASRPGLPLLNLAAIAPAAEVWPVRAAPDLAGIALRVGESLAAVSHHALAMQLQAKADALALAAGDRVALTAPPGSAAAVWQALAPLTVGACVVPIGPAGAPMLFHQADTLAVTVLEVTPSTLRRALEFLFAPDTNCSLSALRWLVCAGETLPAELCRRWIGLKPRIPILYAHGAAAFGGDIAQQVVEWPPAPALVRVPIGAPVAAVLLEVVDRSGRPAQRGAAGELALMASDGTARIRTGDRARALPDGSFDLLGRVGHELVVGGTEIDPCEVETAILRDSAVLQAHVDTGIDLAGRIHLIAYVEFRTGITSPEGALKAAARHSLPPALVPSTFVVLDRFPRTRLGAIDVSRLPDALLTATGIDSTSPATDTEAALLGIWQDVLPMAAPCGVHADFFALGGSSIEAARITQRIQARFGARVSPDLMFHAPTIHGMATLINALPDHQPSLTLPGVLAP